MADIGEDIDSRVHMEEPLQFASEASLRLLTPSPTKGDEARPVCVQYYYVTVFIYVVSYSILVVSSSSVSVVPTLVCILDRIPRGQCLRSTVTHLFFESCTKPVYPALLESFTGNAGTAALYYGATTGSTNCVRCVDL
jgi:hypothetical protein